MNEAIAIGNATLGIVLMLVLFLRVRNVGAELNLKKYRSKEKGVADLLNYGAMVDDGIIVGKNGSFMSAWIYKGDDNASSTDEHRNMVSVRVNQALAGKGNGWMIHVDAVRRAAPNYIEDGLSHFPDPITAAIDEERRRYFEGLGTMYEGFFVLTVTYFPPLLAQSKFVELMFDDDEKGLTKQERTQGLIDTFKRDCLNLESELSIAVKLERLKSNLIINEDGTTVNHDEFLRWLQFCVTGINQPILLPSNPIFLDALICGQEFKHGSIPIMGNKYIQVVAIEGFPLTSTPGILSALAEQPCEYRWSSRFIFMDAHEAVSHLDKYRKKWRQKIRGFFDQVFNLHTGAIDQDAASMAADAETAISEINSGLVTQGYYTSVVVLMDESRSKLETSAQLLHKAITRLGFAARIETVNTTDAFMGSLPGHGTENVRRPLLHTMNLADLIPTSTIWTGENKAPCPFYPPMSPPLMNCVTHGDTPFRLNLHVDDVGHTVIFGPIGAGKSTLLGTLAAQLRRYQGMSIFAFDKGNSLYALAAAIRATTDGKSGKHFTVASDDGKLAFCPLQYLQTKGDRTWAMKWIETMLELNGFIVEPVHRNAIAVAVIEMAERGDKTISNFSTTVQDENIRNAIAQYTVDGIMGHLLDAEEDGLSLSDFTVFEIEELMNLGPMYALPTLLYLFRRIERSLKGQPAAIILDEAWLMLGHPAFREKIREWLKVLRKANCIVIMATQSLSDAANSGILDVLVESTGTKIFLPNIYARDELASALYMRLGLNPRQIEILATAIQKRQYYYISDKGRRLFDLALGPLSLAFVGVSDKDSVAEIKKLETKFGDKWIDEWLANRGLKLSDYMRDAK